MTQSILCAFIGLLLLSVAASDLAAGFILRMTAAAPFVIAHAISDQSARHFVLDGHL